jgi:hypothetical protein
MIKKKLTIWGGNISSTPVYMLNPDLRKQCVVAVRQEDHYEFMEGHFEVWHNGGYSITNTIHCVNTLGIPFDVGQLYTEPVTEVHYEHMEICLFDPNDENDKRILSELSWEQHQEYMKEQI